MQSEKLSIGTKLAYGTGDLGTAIAAALRSFFLLFFFTDVARIDPGIAGLILLINRVWDSVNDPMVGWLSDRTRTRWGRRRPWLLIGAIPFGILSYMTWLVPPFEGTGRVIYYIVVALLLDTFYTVINVPYTALTAELTRDYDERTSLNSYRFAFSVGGALVSLALHPLIVQNAPDLQTGYMWSGLLWAVVSTIPCFVVFAYTRERPESMEEEVGDKTPIIEQILSTFRNKPYRYVIALYLCSWLALQIVSTVLIFYLTYYMKTPDRIQPTLLAIQTMSFLFLFVWTQLSKRLEKRTVFIIGALLWLMVQIGLFLLTPEQSHWVIPLGLLGGAGVSVAYLIPWAMLPDVIEYDEWETDKRREGQFYGFMVLLQKLGIAVGIWLISQAIDWAGYITPTDAVPVPVQPETALQAIRWFIGPVPAIILAIGIVVAFFYPITRKRHAAVVEALRVRHAQAHSAGQGAAVGLAADSAVPLSGA